MTRAFFATFLAVLAGATLAAGHEMRPGYLEIRESSENTYDVLWKVPAKGGNARLGLYLRFSDDVKTVTEPAGGIIGSAYVERLRVQRDGGLGGTTVTIDGLERTFTDVLLRLENADGTGITHRITPEKTSYEIPVEPGGGQVAWTYLGLGMEHILLGIDHLLFVLALLLVVRGWRKLVGTVTAFTIAHSVTLALASLGLVSVPGPPVEAIIALSIVFVAAEIIRGRQGHPGLTARAPWIVAFAFGLLHGFGFAGALSEIGLPQSSIPLALLTFNLGVEAGQLLFVFAVLAIYVVIRRVPISAPEWAWRIPPYAIGGVAAFWMIQRVVGFWE